MNIEEKFNKDVQWLMLELKKEALANAYSQYQIKYLMQQKNNDEPDIKDQRRIVKMLSDRKAITSSPFYHLGIEDLAFQMKGGIPIGYWIQILKPKFDEIYMEVLEQKALIPVEDPQKDTYFLSSINRQVILNDTYILSTPRFNSENANFIEYIMQNANETLGKKFFEDKKIKLKKSFHSILSDLGFKKEIRKIFFEASKTAVKFRNNIPKSDLDKLDIDINELSKEMSKLKRINKKEKDTKRNKKKQ